MQMNYNAAKVTNIKKMSDILSQEQNKKVAILVSQCKQHQLVNALFA
jgi:hypothetical protein